MAVTDAELAIAAADAGATVVRARYRTDLTRFEKSPTDFATDADFEAEQIMLSVLHAARPDDRLVGDESGGTTGEAERTWLVDPLCGTLNYAAGTPLVAVNVALRVSGSTLAAAVADPFSHDVMWTDGTRACLRRGGRDQPMHPSASWQLVDVNLDGPFPNAGWFRAVRMLAGRAFADTFRPRVTSTTLALAWVAAGRRAGYLTDGALFDNVHFSSGIALCQVAGCIVTGLQGQPLHSGVQGLIAAADQRTHAVLLAAVADQSTDA